MLLNLFSYIKAFFYLGYCVTGLSPTTVWLSTMLHFDPDKGIYGVGYILFVYNGTSVPWIISFNNFRFFTNISKTV